MSERNKCALDAEKRAQIVEALAAGRSLDAAAVQVGCGASTIRRERAKFEQTFGKAVEDALRAGRSKRKTNSTLTAEKLEEFCEHLRSGLTQDAAAAHIPCSRTMIQYRANRDPAVQEMIRAATAMGRTVRATRRADGKGDASREEAKYLAGGAGISLAGGAGLNLAGGAGLNLAGGPALNLAGETGLNSSGGPAVADSSAVDAPPNGLLEWSQRFLPEYFRRPPSGMHRWLGEKLDGFRMRREGGLGRRLNVIGPRASAKSTVASLAYLLKCAVEGSEPYIWLVCDTARQARLHFENFKNELLGNEGLTRAYPAAVGWGGVWRSNEIVLNNGVRIEALSTGQRLRGRRQGAVRPTLIICDDLQNDAHIASAEQRERSRAWFHGALMPAGDKGTNVIHLATTLHRDALGLQLAANAGWESRTFRAIEEWPEKLSLWVEWEALYCSAGFQPVAADSTGKMPVLRGPAEAGTPTQLSAPDAARAFYEAHCEEMQRGARLLWPEHEDLYTLMCQRAEIGHTAFEREKQSSPINPAECEWPESYFTEAIWFPAWPKLQMRIVTLDPSKGTDARRGDFSAIVLLGLGEDGLLYVDADLARRPTPQMVADCVGQCVAFQAEAIGIESNQYQELLAGEVLTELRRQKVVHISPYTLNNQVNKLVRIRRLGPLLSAKRLRFKSNSGGAKLLVRQLQDFPQADHDDGPDALEMAIRLLGDIRQARGAG